MLVLLVTFLQSLFNLFNVHNLIGLCALCNTHQWQMGTVQNVDPPSGPPLLD